MKTPRDVLLSRHESANPKLDALRRQVVAEHVVASDAEEREIPQDTPWTRVWCELFASSQRAWLGLAAVWLVIATLQFASRDASSRRAQAGNTIVPWPVNHPVLTEQRRLRAQLLGSHPQQSLAPAGPKSPSPRSENYFRHGRA